MFQISCDGLILHDIRLSKEYRVINPSCSLKLNSAGSMVFKIAPNHPYYDRINKLSSIITLTQDGEWIFSGRVLNDESDFRNIKTIEVEGELSYLVDSNQRTAEYHEISVSDYFKTIIEKHNNMVNDEKKFVIGSVTVTDPNDSLYRFSNYENTLETIQDKLIDRLGGYIRTRHVGTTKYIDYVSDYENVNNQQINFGKNLLDLTKYIQGEEIATAIIPLGAKIESENEETEIRLTIESVNDGLDYVYDEEAVSQYGWIFKTVIYDDVTIAGNLKTKALEELAMKKLLNIKLELNAIDLHLLDVDIERIKLGDKIKVISEPHGINQYMMVSEMKIDIEDPANSTINLGYTVQSLTDITNSGDIKDKVEQIIIDYGVKQDISYLKKEYKNLYSELSRTTENIILKVSSEYASKNDLEAINNEFSSELEVRDNSIEMRFKSFENETKNINGIITSNQQLLEEYIRFKGALIELGKIGNSFVAKLSNEKLAFLQDGVEIAYISNNKLYITDAEIKNMLTIGNPSNGYFDFIPRQNGNLSLKWRNK